MAVGAFSAGLSGLSTNSTALGVIGNNLANINTIGFKSSSVAFADLVSQTLGGTSSNPQQVGLGAAVGTISPTFSQGAIENSRQWSHIAIQGNGFFVVRSGDDGGDYTRAGNFSLDSVGRLVTTDGRFVQGYMTADADGEIVTTGPTADIQVQEGVVRPAKATTTFGLPGNLSANDDVLDTFNASVLVYDALGGDHEVSMTYTKTAASAWTYTATVPGAEVAGGVVGTPFQIGTGTLTFTNGALATVDGAAPADVTFVTPAWTNGAGASTLLWDVVDANNVGTLTGFAAPLSSKAPPSQNGTPAGTVGALRIEQDGSILATLSGGKTVTLGKLAVATFNNPNGLAKIGSNRFSASQAAGLPNIGAAGTGGRGTLIGNATEQSNVDIAVEFTQMILAQRGYQANARTITVSDELLVETLGLKR